MLPSPTAHPTVARITPILLPKVTLLLSAIIKIIVFFTLKRHRLLCESRGRCWQPVVHRALRSQMSGASGHVIRRKGCVILLCFLYPGCPKVRQPG